jgi:uncharacterized membrane protein YeaQ/YmgE (transglycosylase-associated protein family)
VSAVRRLVQGLAAGAVGTTTLDLTTYTDMALTGRPASSAPVDTIRAAADALGASAPHDDDRQEALGALAGTGVGLGVGVVAAAVRGAGVRLPLLAEAAVIGVGAMAATDGPMAVLGVSDLRDWTATDWARDLVPHLLYGAAVAGTLTALEEPEQAGTDRDAPRPAPLLLRSLALGVAAGARSSLGLAPAVEAGSVGVLAAAGLVGTELVYDKKPDTESRIGHPTVVRVVTGAVGAGALARNDGAEGIFPAAAAGAVGAVVGSLLGSVWRGFCHDRSWDWQGALVEDAVSLGLTAYALRASGSVRPG